jgi:hypothetical protein
MSMLELDKTIHFSECYEANGTNASACFFRGILDIGVTVFLGLASNYRFLMIKVPNLLLSF